MKGILFLTILCVSSSYKDNTEIDVLSNEGVPDTVQWWIGESGVWRIRTYGIDHDVHIYSVSGGPHGALELAKETTEKHFGDITCDRHIWHFRDATDELETNHAISGSGLGPRLEISERFVFWKPDDGHYRTQSRPQ